jgi:hypothetical protein
LIALALWPFIYGAIVALDMFLPLRVKNFSATTEKNDQCRVKLKLENEVLEYWRQ